MNAFIRKRNKNYVVYLEFRDDESGKRKQKNMGAFDKKRDANKRLAEVKDSIYKDSFLVPNEITLAGFLLDFLEKYKDNISASTYKSYIAICKNHINPSIGKYRLQELRNIHIQNYIDDLAGNLNPQTIKVHINVLRLAIKRAYRIKLIKENIIDGIESPRIKKFKNEIYDKEHMLKLLEVAKGTNLELPISLAIGLGLRLSEVLGLTWDNIDFDENTITVNKITSRLDGSVILKEPKTESSVRKIFAPIELMNLLKNYRLEQNKKLLRSIVRNEYNLLFFDRKGNPIAEDVMSKKFRKFLENNDLPHIRFHDLRHSHVTLLINSKVPIKVISERVGHSNISTTLSVYSHVLKEMDKEASDKISESLFNAN